MRILGGLSRRTLVVAAAAAASLTTACTPTTTTGQPGNPADFVVSTYGGLVQRWNPCAPVGYEVNDRLNPTALSTVQSAVSQLSRATGITFDYRGTTSFTPQQGNTGAQPAELVISFAKSGSAGGSNLLSGGNQLGEGGFASEYSTINGRITSLKITRGFAVIDSDGYNRASSKVKMAALLHELGHAVGMQHAHFRSEVMYPVVSDSGAGAYSSGDLAGLSKLGRSAGCIN